ncbi:MAG: helicase-related protein [Phycisphaerae bacterium]
MNEHSGTSARPIAAPSDMTFISNESGATLLARFAALLETDTRLLDCLVGYFYISGFHKLYPSLEGVEKVRILVGLGTDHAIPDMLQRARHGSDEPLAPTYRSHAEVKEHFPNVVLRELDAAQYTAEVESGVQAFLQWVRSGKLEIRAHPSAGLHAKVYIMTFHEGDRDAGRVITGSSNLTQSGLQENLEFNVELKNRSDYEFAAAKFNQLWAGAVDVSERCETAISKHSPYAQFTPYELYLKFLYEYFRSELNRPTELDDLYVPVGFKKLKYQEEAVIAARKILDEYGGVFLSDVVGLGKTYMAAMLAQQLDGRSLVIAPPHLIDAHNPGSWRNVFGEFRVPHTDFESIGTLDSLLDRDISRYKNVFIDESHRFRNEDNQTYANLAQICRGKRVILVSATPLNNAPADILSQIKLFQDGSNSTIPNVANLNAFFGGLQKKLGGLDRRNDRDLYLSTVRENAKAAREKVLKYLMIRRTRGEVLKYYGDDLAAQGLKFPDVADPQPLFYKLGRDEAPVLASTVQMLTQGFKYARYKQLLYYQPAGGTAVPGDRNRQSQGQQNLATFMKILMVKRLESSFHAFKLTLDRFIRTYQRVIDAFHNGYVYVSKKHTDKIFDLLEAGDEESLQDLLDDEKAERLSARDFRPDFITDLESDLRVLNSLRSRWDGMGRDPKWEAFKEILRTRKELLNAKLVIFTESRETAEYLGGRIADEVERNVLVSTSESDEVAYRQVTENFDERAPHPRDDYRILVATEVLSEGVNLHRSNIVINYDIPWNPTRLIQRVGRVNRVGTKFGTIRTYNFFPTDEGNDIIKLREAAEAKIHAFIEMLGNDARLLTDGEEIKSHDLFSRLNSKATITGEDEQQETELEYLSEIRRVRDNDPELFRRIKALPKKARSTRTVPVPAGIDARCAFPSLITYFRQGRLDKFFIATPLGNSMELDFMRAAAMLKPADPAEPLSDIGTGFYRLLDLNRNAFFNATSGAASPPGKTGGGQNASYILKRLTARDFRDYHGFTEEDEAFIGQVVRALEDGAMPKITARKVAGALKTEPDPLRVLAILQREIPASLLAPTHAAQRAHAESPREVILSSMLLEAK